MSQFYAVALSEQSPEVNSWNMSRH